MTDVYATPEELVDRLPSLDTHSPTELDDALSAASRWIDTYCGRKFWLDPTVTIRVFKACDLYVLNLGAHEIGDSTGVIVKTDDGTGTFATTVSSSAYQLEPVNAAYQIGGAAPYTRVRALSTSWPQTYVSTGRQELVQITAKYGWPTVPDVVKDACLTLAVARFENPSGVRREAIDGYSVSYGPEASTQESVRQVLMPYRRMWAA